MSVEIRDGRFTEVVGSAMTYERLAEGFLFLEGPLWDALHRRLLFSDIPADTIYEWNEVDGVKTLRAPSGKSNGLAFDLDGQLLCCEHATSRLTRIEVDGGSSVLAHEHRGRELNSPNDVVVRSDGGIYFTDPTYGRMDFYGVPREPQLGFRGVYRVEPRSNELTLVADDFAQPNGLCFSLDERELFVNDTERGHVRVFDVRGDGTLSGGRVWIDVTGEGEGAPDGMKLDRDGNLYCCGPGGIHVFDRAARCLGVIRVPTPVANFTWGDDDRRSLFIAATGSLYRARVRTPGRPASAMTTGTPASA